MFSGVCWTGSAPKPMGGAEYKEISIQTSRTTWLPSVRGYIFQIHSNTTSNLNGENPWGENEWGSGKTIAQRGRGDGNNLASLYT